MALTRVPLLSYFCQLTPMTATDSCSYLRAEIQISLVMVWKGKKGSSLNLSSAGSNATCEGLIGYCATPRSHS